MEQISQFLLRSPKRLSTVIITSADSPYTAQIGTDVIICSGSGTITINLPSATSITGKAYEIKHQGSSLTVNVTPNGAQTIDGVTPFPLTVFGESLSIRSYGAGWAVTPNDTWAVAITYTQISQNVNFNAQAIADCTYYQVTADGNDIVCTLPDATLSSSKTIAVQKIDLSQGTVSFTGTAGQFPTDVLYFKDDSILMRSNGSTWEILSTYSKISLDKYEFGDGSDGDVTVSGSLTLTKDMNYNKLTLTTGSAITCNGFRILCKSYLDITSAPAGAISCVPVTSGSAGGTNGSTGGAVGTVMTGNTVGGPASGSQTGAAGGTGAGTQATTVAAATLNYPTSTDGTAIASGAGGTGSNGAGGALRTTTTSSTLTTYPRAVRKEFHRWVSSGASAMINGGCPGQSGSSGGGDGTNSGGGGGAGGKGGGTFQIWARKIIRGAGTAANAIRCNGGAAGSGGSPTTTTGGCGGGGGGGGGSGGSIYIVYGELLGTTATNAIQAKGGNGGNGGTGVGTGTNGNGGWAGSSGRVFLVDAYNYTFSDNIGSAGVANSTQTGGVAAEFQVSL